MIPPREKVWIGIPTIDRRLDIGLFAGLFGTQQFYLQPYFYQGHSNICYARNRLAHMFVEKYPDFDWFQFLDADIIFSPTDWELLWEGDEDVVTAQYSKKILGAGHAKFGLGFTRVHRRVFEKIKELKSDEGQEYAQRYYEQGDVFVNYFPNGATSDARWLSEDHGFFRLCAETGSSVRDETRTRLKHVGTLEYEYPNPLSVQTLAMLVAMLSNDDKEQFFLQLENVLKPKMESGAQ